MHLKTLFSVLASSVVLLTVNCAVQKSDDAAPLVFTESDSAISRAQSLIEQTPDSPAGYTALAAALIKESRRSGNFALNAQAREAVRQALKIAPDDLPAQKLEASLLLSYHEFAEALDKAKKLQANMPSDPFLFGVLSDAYLELGEYDNAVESTQRMVDLKPNAASYARVAQLRSLHGDHKGAVEMYTQAARTADPMDKETQSWSLVQLGDEFWKYGRYVDAERVYDEALVNYPDYFLARVAKGRLRASLGDLDAAEQILIEVLSQMPNANAMLLLGDIYAVKGDDIGAGHQYDLFESMQDKLGVAADHKRLGLLWAQRGKLTEAMNLANHEYAAEKSIHSADLMAWSLYNSGRADEAQSYIREALRLNTNDARTMFHAGMISKAVGDKRDALRHLNAALKINPSFDLIGAIEAKGAIAELR